MHWSESSRAHLEGEARPRVDRSSTSPPICPCRCLQSPGSQFSPRLTLRKRLVNHILGLSPRPQSVSVPADYLNCASPRLRAGSARAQRPVSWACVCSHPRGVKNSSLGCVGNLKKKTNHFCWLASRLGYHTRVVDSRMLSDAMTCFELTHDDGEWCCFAFASPAH